MSSDIYSFNCFSTTSISFNGACLSSNLDKKILILGNNNINIITFLIHNKTSSFTYGQYKDIEGNWTLKETKVYITIIHSTYHIQFSHFASHQLFITGIGNEMSENRAAAKESS